MMKLKIYIVDDEPSIRDTFRWYLEDLGHEVVALEIPEYCAAYQDKCCEHDIPCADALLIDYHMPSINGLEFLEKMDASGCRGIHQNVMLMSGDTTKIDMERVSRLGCRVMQKPISLDVVATWIEEVARDKQAAE
ncbi:MAG: response regulator [Desulfuromonadales bacterium]|nr:response regulator [Desulfuromonadales bacterium]